MLPSILLITSLIHVSQSVQELWENGNVTLVLNTSPIDGIKIQLYHGNYEKLTGKIGAGFALVETDQCEESSKCYSSPTQEDISLILTPVENGFGVHWSSNDLTRIFSDCFDLDEDWFSGRVWNPTDWPIQKAIIENLPYIVDETAYISEPYWFNSLGAFIFVNETTPLFIDQNNLAPEQICLIAQNSQPYLNRNSVSLNYTIAANENARLAHFDAIINYLGRPSGQPDSKMIEYPIWSPSVKYPKEVINETSLLDFAQKVKDNGFRGQIQIDDGWENCYGTFVFDETRFPNINDTIIDISVMALQITLWIHPFVNDECTEIADIGKVNNFFVKNETGSDLVSWWNGERSHLIDFTNEEARQWFTDRVGNLLEKHWINGFSFHAGEASYILSTPSLTGDPNKSPNQITTDYFSITNFSTVSSVHSGYRTQQMPVYVRLPDKEPNWSKENGLHSVIINLLQSNLAGYTIALPGLIGGKGEKPTTELFIRWLQAVTLMPGLQFGHLPWEFDDPEINVTAITKKFIDLHSWYKDKIRNVMIKSRTMGRPVNGPIWWIDYANPEAYQIDDQFLLSEDFIVAPILQEGAISRDIWLPPGNWADGNDYSKKYNGNQWLRDFPAPIDTLPYFILEKETYME